MWPQAVRLWPQAAHRGGIDEACRSTCWASWPHAEGKITEEMGIDEATNKKNQSD